MEGTAGGRFVAQMEEVLEVYRRPYDPRRPVICFDEGSKLLQGHIEGREPLPPRVRTGAEQRVDYTYEPKGSGSYFLFCEPLGGWRDVRVTDSIAGIKLAPALKWLVDEVYPHAERVVLVSDNLKTHHPGVLYQLYSPEEARRIAERIEWRYTPVHGSWLNVAEIELSALHGQCLPDWRRIPSIEALTEEIAAWVQVRNQEVVGVDWHFTARDARIKLRRLYPVPLVKTLC